MTVECSSSSLTVYSYDANSKCDPVTKQARFKVDWGTRSEVCINDQGINLSYKFRKDTAREQNYYKQAYAVQEWMRINRYDSNAGSCLIYGYEVYIDSDCQLRSDSIDEEVELQIDVAN